ncbi:MAG: hypothetical protein WDZ85_02195 [Candidatus Paceibacterota bacterium]
MSIDITVKIDNKRDLSLIKDFFFKTSTHHFKERILRFYRNLPNKLERLDEPKQSLIIDKFFSDIYQDKKSQIKSIAEESQAILDEKFPACFQELSEIMNYYPIKQKELTGIITLLPFSPFDWPVFYFSTVKTLFGNGENDILEITTHEISHLILFEILTDRKIDLTKSKPQKNFRHLFKESLTGMLLSENKLSKLLGTQGYKGNPEVHNLNIESGNKVMPLREYLRINLHHYQDKDSKGHLFLEQVIKILSVHIQAFSDKREFWIRHEQDLRNGDTRLIDEYEKPIKID